MTKRVLSVFTALLLVSSLLLVSPIKTEAKSYAGAYKANYTFCVYIQAFDAGSSNGAMAWPTDVNGFVYPITVSSGSVYAADSDGYITIYYNYGLSWVKAYAPSYVSAGKMTKIY